MAEGEDLVAGTEVRLEIRFHLVHPGIKPASDEIKAFDPAPVTRR
jgi:hypothetical protein